MNITKRGYVYLYFIFISAAFSYLITHFGYFPHLGMAIALLTFAVTSFIYKKTKNQITYTYFILTILFALFLAIRSEGFLTFINFVSTFFFGSLMLTSGGKESDRFSEKALSPLIYGLKSLFTKSEFYPESKNGKTGKKGGTNAFSTIVGILMSLLILIIVLPLLASANPYFKEIVDAIGKLFNITELLKNVSAQTLFIWSIRLTLFLGFLFMIPKMITLAMKNEHFNILPPEFNFKDISLHIPKIVLSIVLAVFFATQIRFYLADSDTLNRLGYSLSQHAREVFGQLSIVAGIVLLLIYNDKEGDRRKSKLTVLLGIMGVFLTLMAYKSVFEYINAWGLTYKRLYGVSFATWILGIFAIYFRVFRSATQADLFVRNTLIMSGIILVIINVVNFDYLIYHFRKASTGEGVDYTYLSTISADSLSYRDQFLKLQDAVGRDGYPYSLNTYNNKNPYILIYKIEYLQRKYREFDLRTWNLLDYLAYLDVKTLDTGKIKSVLIAEDNFNLPQK